MTILVCVKSIDAFKVALLQYNDRKPEDRFSHDTAYLISICLL